MDTSQFIKYVKLDEQKRILISVQQQFESYLQLDKNRQMLKKAAINVLKSDFQKLEIGKNICRITVLEGTEEVNLHKVKTELIKGLEFALKFLKK